MHAVIIGLSAAGLSCLDTLLKFSPHVNVTAISEEKYSPYCRCALTHYLGRIVREDQMYISDVAKYPDNVKFIFGEKVEAIDANRKVLTLSGGNEIFYDKVLVATGANAIKPNYCDEEKKIFTLRYMSDAKKLEQHIKDKATVLGGGFVGIKAAYGLLERNIKVEMIVSSPYPLSLVLDEKTARFIEKEIRESGIDMRMQDDIAEINLKQGGVAVFLKSGAELISDVVVVGKGVKPRVEIARKAGIKIDLGIMTNEFLETSAEGVYAAGDCCETMDVARRVPWINALWPVAVEQGYFAALNMLGGNIPYQGSIGMNSLKTHSFHLISGGVMKEGSGATIFERHFPHKKQYRKLAVKDNVLVGMAFYNCPDDAGTYINLIKKGMPLNADPQNIVDGEVSIADLLKPL
jgi:NAD(P)H-nitrite reductase large subunit